MGIQSVFCSSFSSFKHFPLASLFQAFHFSVFPLSCSVCFLTLKAEERKCRRVQEGFSWTLCLGGLWLLFNIGSQMGEFLCFRVSSPQIFSGGAQGTFQDGFLSGLSSSVVMVDSIFWVLTDGQQETGTVCPYNFRPDQSPHGSNSDCLSHESSSLTHPSCLLSLLCKWKFQFS